MPNFQGVMAGKIGKHGPKTGNSFVMNIGKWEISDKNFGGKM